MLRQLGLFFVLLVQTSVVPHALLDSRVGFNQHPTRPSSSQTIALSRGFDPTYKLTLRNPVQDKNFYLLSLFQRDPEVGRLLKRNAALRRLSHTQVQALRRAAKCGDVECFDRLFRLTNPTIEMVARELQRLGKRPQLTKLVRNEMRPSGVFIKYRSQADTEMLISAWRDAAKGMNRLLTVYLLGKNPFYKDIDRVSFDVAGEEYRNLVKTKLREIQLGKDPLFFEPTLEFGLKLLEANRRDEAGRYEPLEAGENRAAVENLRNIRWDDYPYSFILVLGSGPGDLSTRVSRIGASRADQGAQLFLDRKAPLIILSGGHVHPMQTPFNESIEMKKYLIEKFQIPQEGILVDPFARHTPTNFRNAARLAFRYGLPADRKALVTSSEAHIEIVTKEGFRIRCSTELGYFPLEFIERISPIAAEFKPSVTSLFFDVNDPLDP
jgi:hypothetical protein